MRDPYLAENISWMRRRESELPRHLNQSPELDKRRFIVDFTCLSAEHFSLPRSTTHLGVVLYDRFLDGHHITNSDTLHLVALACLTLAAKFDCKESQVPKLKKLRELLPKPTILRHRSDYRRLESLILEYFRWNIYIPSPTHYVDLLRDFILDPSDMMGGSMISDIFNSLIGNLMDFVHYFLDISMQQNELLGVAYVKIGASCIYCARAVLGVAPLWPINLQRLLGGLLVSDFEVINKILLNTYVSEDSIQCEATSESNAASPSPPRKKARHCPQTPVTDEGYVSRTSFAMEGASSEGTESDIFFNE